MTFKSRVLRAFFGPARTSRSKKLIMLQYSIRRMEARHANQIATFEILKLVAKREKK